MEDLEVSLYEKIEQAEQLTDNIFTNILVDIDKDIRQSKDELISKLETLKSHCMYIYEASIIVDENDTSSDFDLRKSVVDTCIYSALLSVLADRKMTSSLGDVSTLIAKSIDNTLVELNREK